MPRPSHPSYWICGEEEGFGGEVCDFYDTFVLQFNTNLKAPSVVVELLPEKVLQTMLISYIYRYLSA